MPVEWWIVVSLLAVAPQRERERERDECVLMEEEEGRQGGAQQREGKKEITDVVSIRVEEGERREGRALKYAHMVDGYS